VDSALTGYFNFAQITLASLVIILILSTVLCTIISLVYRMCIRGTSYSASFQQTIILIGVIVSVIMLIIGSNIARAFSLVGALSIIRFRTAIKDPLDVGYLFFSMAVGMACGTQFYGIAVITTFFISAVILLLTATNFGSRQVLEYFLEIQFFSGTDPGTLMAECLDKFTARSVCNRIETVMGGALLEASYTLQLKPAASEKEFLNTLREINGNNKVRLIFKSPGFEI
jgi:hypothetical protein